MTSTQRDCTGQGERDSPRLLVVDDDPTTIELVSGVLGANGYSCLRASDGVEALQIIGARPGIALAISDINMPGMNGLAFLERLNATGATAPRVIFLTAYPSMDFAVAALRLGALDFLTKPIRPHNLLDVVRNALTRIQQGQRARPDRHGHSPDRRSRAGTAEPRDIALLGLNRLRSLRRSFAVVADLDDVAWDLLRQLLSAERHSQRLSVSALSGSVEDVSDTTALRRIHELVKAGIIIRSPDPTDARRDFVSLAPQIRSTLDQYLERIAHDLAEIARMN